MYKLKALNLLLLFSPLIFFHSILAYVIPLDLVLFCYFFVFLTNSVPSKIRTEVHSLDSLNGNFLRRGCAPQEIIQCTRRTTSTASSIQNILTC